MTQMYTERTIDVNPDCAPGVLYGAGSLVHDTHMAVLKEKKSVAPPSIGAEFAPTFIKQWRKTKGVTQEKLAEMVADYLAARGDDSGYTHASISRLERGQIGYTQTVLEAIADALGTNPGSLLTRDPTRAASDQSAMWNVWEQALPEERALIAQQAEVVIRNRRKSA